MYREIEIQSGGATLPGRLFVPEADGGQPAARPALLFLHGQRSSQSGYRNRAEAAVDRLGAICLTFDFLGHGDAPGDVEDTAPLDHLGDAIAAYDVLVSQPGVDPSRVGLCGASYGAYVGAQLTGQRDVRKALLRAPALYEEAHRSRQLGEGRRSTVPRERPGSLEGLRSLGSDLLILESEHDEVIPPAVVQAYLSWFPEAEHRVLAGARHGLDAETDAVFVAEILGWFADL